MVVEDFPVNGINLTYSDGSKSFKYPQAVRSKRSAIRTVTGTTVSGPAAGGTTLSGPTASSTTAATTAGFYRTTGVSLGPSTPGRQQNTNPLSKLPLQFSFLGKSNKLLIPHWAETFINVATWAESSQVTLACLDSYLLILLVGFGVWNDLMLLPSDRSGPIGSVMPGGELPAEVYPTNTSERRTHPSRGQ